MGQQMRTSISVFTEQGYQAPAVEHISTADSRHRSIDGLQRYYLVQVVAYVCRWLDSGELFLMSLFSTAGAFRSE